MLKTEIPTSITMPAMTRPGTVTGYRSPYPTVVAVSTDHHSASGNEVIVARGADDSNGTMIQEPSSSTRTTPMAAHAEAFTCSRCHRSLPSSLRSR